MSIKLPTQKTSIAVGPKESIMLFYGPPGIGKTTFVNAMYPRVLFISTDRGTRWVSAMRLECGSMTRLKEIVEALEKQKEDPYDLVCIDHLDDILNWCETEVCRKYNIESLSDAKWGKGWKAYKNEIQEIVQRLKRIKSGIVFICHETIRTVKTRVSELDRTMPSISKSGWNVVIPLVDMVGYCGFKMVKDKETGKRKEVRTLETQPTETLYAKDRTTRKQPEKGWMPLDGKLFISTFK